MLTPPTLLVPLGQASCFVKQGKFQQAEQLYKEILSLQDQELSTPRAGKSPALGSPFPGEGEGQGGAHVLSICTHLLKPPPLLQIIAGQELATPGKGR